VQQEADDRSLRAAALLEAAPRQPLQARLREHAEGDTHSAVVRAFRRAALCASCVASCRDRSAALVALDTASAVVAVPLKLVERSDEDMADII
jgi:hypothetical protein